MRLHIIRHADPDYANDSLTEQGRREAAALARYLCSLGLHEIYSSPAGRARLTAQYTAEATALPVTVEDWTAELKGLRVPGEKRVLWDLDGDEVRQPAYLKEKDNWGLVERFDAVRAREEYQRVVRASDEFLARQGFVRAGGVYQVRGENRKHLAAFCHGGFGPLWVAHLLEIPLPLMWAGFFMHPSSVTTILFDERKPGLATPRCLGYGELAHLRLAGLPPSPSGIIANYE